MSAKRGSQEKEEPAKAPGDDAKRSKGGNGKSDDWESTTKGRREKRYI